MSRSEQGNDAAAAWIIRREKEDWSDIDQIEFDHWLAESDGNKAAYWRLKHSWREADRIGSLGLGSRKPVGRAGIAIFWKPVALAASLLLIIGFGVTEYGGPQSSPRPVATQYDTPVGGHRLVALVDGSTIELNTRTALRTTVTNVNREIWLDRGEAFFAVRHDPVHPFVIYAGPKRVTVLGTKFLVRREGDKISVAVLEGRVRIDDAAAPIGESTSSTILTGGALAFTQGRSTLVTQKSEEGVRDELAWRDGLLKFDQTPLSGVAAEFNRYNLRQIIVTDPAVADIRIGGTFQASNVVAFTRLLRDAYGLKIEDSAETIRISN